MNSFELDMCPVVLTVWSVGIYCNILFKKSVILIDEMISLPHLQYLHGQITIIKLLCCLATKKDRCLLMVLNACWMSTLYEYL